MRDVVVATTIITTKSRSNLLHDRPQQERHYNVFITKIVDENAPLMVLDMNDYSVVEFVEQTKDTISRWQHDQICLKS